VVTPSFNQAEYLEETIRSVLLQGYPDLEYIVLDGGSTDGSVEIIERYAPWLSHWTSGPDGGQACAINAGLQRASGDIFNWINSDDYLLPGALHTVAEAWSREPDKLIGCSLLEVDPEGHTLRSRRSANLTTSGMLTYWHGVGFPQQGIWVPMSLVREVGVLNTAYDCCFDWEWILRLTHAGAVQYVDRAVAAFRDQPDSKTNTRDPVFVREMEAITREYGQRWGTPAQRAEHEAFLRRQRWRQSIEDIRTEHRGLPAAARILAHAAPHPDRLRSRFTWGAVRRCFRRA
jgi:glycosyltransferase involved in cell wall biosynthesis